LDLKAKPFFATLHHPATHIKTNAKFYVKLIVIIYNITGKNSIGGFKEKKKKKNMKERRGLKIISFLLTDGMK